MENMKIRVNTGIKIEVNDNGDTITARLDDSQFVAKFYDIVDLMEKISEHMSSEEMQSKDEREQFNIVEQKTKEVMTQIDGLFGEDSCKKVFGDIIPSGYAMADFFEQLIPIFERYANDRQKAISEKYNRNRKGKKK